MRLVNSGYTCTGLTKESTLVNRSMGLPVVICASPIKASGAGHMLEKGAFGCIANGQLPIPKQ